MLCKEPVFGLQNVLKILFQMHKKVPCFSILFERKPQSFFDHKESSRVKPSNNSSSHQISLSAGFQFLPPSLLCLQASSSVRLCRTQWFLKSKKYLNNFWLLIITWGNNSNDTISKALVSAAQLSGAQKLSDERERKLALIFSLKIYEFSRKLMYKI